MNKHNASDCHQAGGAEKIAVCNELLAKVQRGMHGVTVQAPDHDTLKLFCMLRRLFKPTRRRLTVEQAGAAIASLATRKHRHLTLLLRRPLSVGSQELEITRSFAEGYTRVKSHPRVKAVMENVAEYCDVLDSFKLDDYQVAQAQASGYHHYRQTNAVPGLFWTSHWWCSEMLGRKNTKPCAITIHDLPRWKDEQWCSDEPLLAPAVLTHLL